MRSSLSWPPQDMLHSLTVAFPPPAYVAATSTAVLLAVGLTRFVPRIPASVMSAAKRDLLVKLVPFASVAGAGVVKSVASLLSRTLTSALGR